MDYEQAGKLILGMVFLILLIALVIVRRGMKPEPARTVSTIEIALQCDTGPTLAALRPVTAELQRQAELAERVTAAQCRAFDNAKAVQREPAKKPTAGSNRQTRKVRAGTPR